MRRPWYTWVLFGLSLAVLLTGMGWVTWVALDMDWKAELEERVRLALWRMDSEMLPLIVRESRRPYYVYQPFYPADRAYNRMLEEIRPGEIILPSPLLTQRSRYIVLYFQMDSGGELTSPQVPTGVMRKHAEAKYTTGERIESASRRLAELKRLIQRQRVRRELARTRSPHEATDRAPGTRPVADTRANGRQESGRDDVELQARAQTVRQAMSSTGPGTAPGSGDPNMVKSVGVAYPQLLVRGVNVGGKRYIQGFWLDWPKTRKRLLERIADLLPNADLKPFRVGEETGDSRIMASLSVKIIPGDLPRDVVFMATPIRVSLLIAWVAVLVATTAVAILLKGAVTLGERRGDFVSAVTHELRTPLTTFKMYTEMLSENMVTDEKKRQRYLNTIRTEADRLGHLVENVLAYARLERGRRERRLEHVGLAELVERATDGLAARAEQADMSLVTEIEDAASSVHVLADAPAVEQILINLVDNACKYAAAATDRRIHLTVRRENSRGVLEVRDHGPGISKSNARRLFKPFWKSATAAANSAPGVGLGLAICRRLARDMKGSLRLGDNGRDGATFVLKLPLA